MKKRVMRITVIFFSVMMTLTFCSRTIYRATIPKVRVVKPYGGTLKHNMDIEIYDICADTYLYEYIPFELPQPLNIDQFFVSPGTIVSAGDALAAFYAPGGAYLLQEAEEDLLFARDVCSEWEVALLEAAEQLNQKLIEAQTPSEIKILHSQRDLLVSGILNGNSTRIVYGNLQTTQKLVEYLRMLEKNNWILYASTSGTVCSIAAKNDLAYSGLAPLCQIADADASIFINIQLPNTTDLHYGNWKRNVYIETVDGFILAEMRSGNSQSIQVNIPKELKVSDILSIVVRLESPYEQFLIPNEAVHDDKVYLVESTVGAWGQRVYRVRVVNVITGNADWQSTAIVEGLNKNNEIIVSSTEDLIDGQIVLMDNLE